MCGIVDYETEIKVIEVSIREYTMVTSIQGVIKFAIAI